jgi:hypothetical protein
LFVLSTLYTYRWDLVHDWDLPARMKPDGRRMVWTDRWPYLTAAACNLVARFCWMLSVMPGATPLAFAFAEYLVPYLGFVEIARRTTWSFIRLEKEHLAKGVDYDKTVQLELRKRAAAAEESAAPRSASADLHFVHRLQASAFVVAVIAVFIVAYSLDNK